MERAGRIQRRLVDTPLPTFQDPILQKRAGRSSAALVEAIPLSKVFCCAPRALVERSPLRYVIAAHGGGLPYRPHQVQESGPGPLLEAGLLAMTIPDKPNSRLRRYRTAESGENLSGK